MGNDAVIENHHFTSEISAAVTLILQIVGNCKDTSLEWLPKASVRDNFNENPFSRSRVFVFVIFGDDIAEDHG
jgi:hypothetical protein